MKRTSINPWDWGLAFSMDQGEIIEDAKRYMHLSGQVALEPDADSEMGIKIMHPGDLRAQMEDSFANVDAVLEKAGMTRKNILTLRFFSTDVDGFLENYDVYAQWIEPAGIRPPQSLLGVQRLVMPDLLVEIEATAAD